MKNKFSQKHPLLFGLSIVVAAVVLTFGATAFFSALRSGDISWFATKVGVVDIRGTIDESRRTTKWVQALAEDPAVKAVLVRIDSPGGGVAPSQEIHDAVRELTKRKPVVASLGSVAASGGYYIACAADKIVANPGSITGSIGVKAQLMSVQELMQRMGIKDQTVSSGPFKDSGSPTHTLSEKEKAYFQDLIDDLYRQFVLAVAQGRNLPLEKVREIADGRAFTGRQAKELGLVDSLGGMHAAMQQLRDMAGIQGRISTVRGPEEPASLWTWIVGQVRSTARGVMEKTFPRLPEFSYLFTP